MTGEPYCWTPESGLSIDEYLKKRRPSMVTAPDTDWIWVNTKTEKKYDTENNEMAKAIGRGKVVLDGLQKRLEKIEKDESIPVRAKKGQKSKKVVRDEALADAVAEIKKISVDSGCTGGKWMLFPGHENVDKIWGQIARSVAHGPLKDAGVTTAKVAPTNEDDESRPHLICIYFDNVYDLDLVRKVVTVLLTEHGIEPNSVKSDLYTLMGIDSNHPTKLRSTIWRVNEVIEGGGEAVKALKAGYKPSKEAAANKAGAEAESPAKAEPSSTKTVSFSEETQPTETKRKDVDKDGEHKPAKRVKSAAAKFKEDDMFAGSEGEDD